MKKKVIAYLHTHLDREWYREFEIFRLRLLRIFDNVLDLLEQNKIPSFYFDGQVIALLDYLKIRPEKESQVRKFIAEKRLFIGPYYCLTDEFLTDRTCFKKNLEIGIKIAKDFGCEDFIGYQADTFGHSKNVPIILKEFGIDKCMVWRGCPESIPSEFTFNGINTVNMISGYFMDIFSSTLPIEKKAEFLKNHLDSINKKSADVLLLPIGGDHLGIETDIVEQIQKVNELLDDYEIILSNPFEYFELVKDNFEKCRWDDELRDNSKTFILSGCYSARTNLKQYNVDCTYKLDLANKLQKKLGRKYENIIDYAYKLLLQNQAHDGICGCSTDLVHEENVVRYEKILQITNAIIGELRLTNKGTHYFSDDYKLFIPFESHEIHPDAQILSKTTGFESDLLYDTQRIPMTEDYTEIYTQIKEPFPSDDALFVSKKELSNSHIALKIEGGKINLYTNGKKYKDFISFTRCVDQGDTYNFGPKKRDKYAYSKIKRVKILNKGPIRTSLIVHTNFFDIEMHLHKNSKLIHIKINAINNTKDSLMQVHFNLPNPVETTFSEDMNTLIERNFDPDYEMRKNLPNKPGIEVKTNFAPMQRFVWTQNFGVITKGLTEYEATKNKLSITLLRSTGIISNPKNPARSTPAGPPIPVPGAQQIGRFNAEFAIGFFDKKDYQKHIEELFLPVIEL